MIEMRGSIVPAILPKIFISFLIGLLASFIVEYDILGKDKHITFDFSPFAGLGIAISLFLGFYNNAAYARWWEARTYWGES